MIKRTFGFSAIAIVGALLLVGVAAATILTTKYAQTDLGEPFLMPTPFHLR